jgi:hypothetical protein
MSNLLFLNIGHDINNLIVQAIASLDKVRGEIPQLKIVL